MLADENCLTFAEAARRLPKIGKKRISVSTIWRWAHRGARGVKLESRLLGGRYLTSMEALDRFSAAIAETSASRPTSQDIAPPRRRKDAQRRVAVEQARKRLEAAGI